MGAPAGSLESLRDLNRLRIVDALKAAGSASRAEIARKTGLSRSTVSTVIGELIEQGLIVETDDSTSAEHRPRRPEGQQGRPPVMLTLNPAAGMAVGIDFSHDHVRVAVSDLSRTLLGEDTVEVDVDHEATASIEAAVELTSELLLAAGTGSGRVVGAGVAVSAPVDHRRGMVHPSAIMPGWRDIDIAGELGARLKMPVHLDNDANLGALAEVTLGAGRNARDAVYIQMSSGIGAGLIIDGRPYRGDRGTAGEIGHLLVDESGPICRCGNRGCLETLASGPALVRLMRASGTPHGDLTVRSLVQLAISGDGGARRAISDAGRAVGRAAAAVCNLINPEMIVIGGELSEAGAILLEPVRDSIRRYALPAATDELEVVVGALGEHANVLGALALAIGHADEVITSSLATSLGV